MGMIVLAIQLKTPDIFCSGSAWIHFMRIVTCKKRTIYPEIFLNLETISGSYPKDNEKRWHPLPIVIVSDTV
jgi:hypothetical protein